MTLFGLYEEHDLQTVIFNLLSVLAKRQIFRPRPVLDIPFCSFKGGCISCIPVHFERDKLLLKKK